MAIRRVVCPELLDDLPEADPAARRSRRDLRRINAMMGNFDWVNRTIAPFVGASSRIIEIGAGEGVLLQKLAKRFPEARVGGVDRAPRPPQLPGQVGWRQGDIFNGLSGEVVVGVMIVHHFSEEQLRDLGRHLENFRVICLCEPWRSAVSRFLGRLLLPLVGQVTRHDMMVSIDAGFREGELPRLLGLANWSTRESIDWRGSYRLIAWR